MWVPSHCGIKGNEKADQLARQAIQDIDEVSPYKWHPKELKSEMVRQSIFDWKQKWSQSDKGRFCYSIFPNPSTVSWFKDLKLSRRTTTSINRIIANHSIFATGTCCIIYNVETLQGGSENGVIGDYAIN